MPAVQKQAAGRRAKMLADAPVPVVDAPARIADVPVYLNGVGTAKARNTVTVRPQVDGQHPQHQVQGRAGRQARRRAGADRSRHLSGAARPGDGQEGAGRGAARQRPARPRALRPARRPTSWRRRPSTRSARWSTQFTAQIKLDDAAIANAKAFLDYTTIVAPIDGRTGIRMVDEGNLVRAVRRRHRHDHRDPADRRDVHAAAAAAGPDQRGAGARARDGRGARRRRQDRARSRHAAGRRQPGRPDHRHRAHEGGVPQRQPAALAGPVRQRAHAGRDLEPGRGHADPGRAARPQRHLRLRRAGRPARGPAADHGGPAERDHRRRRQGHRRVRAGRHHRLLPPQGRRARRRCARRPRSQPAGADAGKRRGAATTAKSEAREKTRTACAADMQKFCANVERGGTAYAPACRRNAAELSDGCKAAGAGQKGGKAREADARKAEGSSPQ